MFVRFQLLQLALLHAPPILGHRRRSNLYLEQVAFIADGRQQVTELNRTISLQAFSSDLAYECESHLLTFHRPKQVTCASLSG